MGAQLVKKLLLKLTTTGDGTTTATMAQAMIQEGMHV